jgi:hypothetical protein
MNYRRSEHIRVLQWGKVANTWQNEQTGVGDRSGHVLSVRSFDRFLVIANDNPNARLN